LSKLSCQYNQLTNLNVKNGNNSSIINADFDATNNSLPCITVDDPIYSTTNWTNIDPNVYFVTLDCSLYTVIPDQNFETKLISLGLDSGPIDGLVLNSNTLLSLDVSSSNISDLTGIEAFNNLIYLYCDDNQLTSLDVSNHTNLSRLDCDDNQLTSLDVSMNTNLSRLDCRNNLLTSLDVSINTGLSTFNCFNNLLTSLDVSNNTGLLNFSCNNNQITSLNVTNNTNLNELSCAGNPLTSLDVTNNINLSSLWCGGGSLTSLDVTNNMNLSYLICAYTQVTSLDVSNNTSLLSLSIHSNQLTSLDVSNNTNLYNLDCTNNQLTNLDVSNNTNLNKLECSGNQLTSLDVSNNTNLGTFFCSSNQLTSLDVSNNTNLYQFWCHGNQLTSLDVRNGNNANFNLFWAQNNSLSCIFVDDPVYSTANWTNIDPGVVFDISCPPINDVCADAIVMLDGDPPITSLTINSTNIEALTPCSGGGGGGDCPTGGTGSIDFTKGVWFKYTSITAGESITIATDNVGTNFDTEIQVFTGSCGALTCVGGDDDGGDGSGHQFDSKFCFVTTASSTDYYIYVDGHNSAIGTAVVTLEVVPYALPVELISFKGDAMDRTNMLKWETASEENTQYHIIQRSADGNANWEEIGRLDAAGNSTVTNQYSLEDTQPLGFGYYRLISLDYDGYMDYSDIISIKREMKEDQVQLFPNPVSELLTIEIGVGVSANYEITIVNIMGQVVSYDNHDFKEGNQRIEMEVNHLANGVYHLVVESKTGKQIKRFVKQ
jgi:Leucine-rich repeat (LRR) protein